MIDLKDYKVTYGNLKEFIESNRSAKNISSYNANLSHFLIDINGGYNRKQKKNSSFYYPPTNMICILIDTNQKIKRYKDIDIKCIYSVRLVVVDKRACCYEEINEKNLLTSKKIPIKINIK